MQDFSERFRKRDSGGASANSNGFNDSFNDGFNDSFNDGFDDSFDGSVDNGLQENRSSDTSGRSVDEKTDVQEEARQERLPDNAKGNPEKKSDEKVDLRESFGALFQAISGLFTGKTVPNRSAEVYGSDAAFARQSDHSVDEGFGLPWEESHSTDADADVKEFALPQEAFPSSKADSEGPLPDYFPDGHCRHENDDVEISPDDAPGNDGDRIYEDEPFLGQPDDGEQALSDESDFNDQEERGLFAALAASFAEFRRRLPSFRPKVYVLPQTEYRPEQDGIQTPSLASDIRRIIDEQNKPGETEQEYEQMRHYIRSVSTDTRLRPEDIKAPDNIGEVRAAENELYDLINEISSSNEQQRSKIGVYERPPEQDPYNYRGINNDRQYYIDMESYSFDMKPSYGFESEEKIDPDRKNAEMQYYSIYNQMTGQSGDDSVPKAQNQSDGFNDGFEDDFDDDFGSLDEGLYERRSEPGRSNGGFDDGFDDDFGSPDEGLHDRRNEPGRSNGGFDDGFDDDFGKNGVDDYFNW